MFVSDSKLDADLTASGLSGYFELDVRPDISEPLYRDTHES